MLQHFSCIYPLASALLYQHCWRWLTHNIGDVTSSKVPWLASHLALWCGEASNISISALMPPFGEISGIACQSWALLRRKSEYNSGFSSIGQCYICNAIPVIYVNLVVPMFCPTIQLLFSRLTIGFALYTTNHLFSIKFPWVSLNAICPQIKNSKLSQLATSSIAGFNTTTKLLACGTKLLEI